MAADELDTATNGEGLSRQVGEGSRADNPHNIALDYLRAFVIVLVVLHHAAMGYFPIPDASPVHSLAEHLQSVHALSPVNDPAHSIALLIVVATNDRFFMFLMFFLSGLFVWKSLETKGRRFFVRDRLIRLGIPFLAMTAMAPLTWYPAHLVIAGNGGPSSFWNQWFSLPASVAYWSSPSWFLWLLLAYDLAAVLLFSIAHKRLTFLHGTGAALFRRPALGFAVLVLLSAMTYLPMAAVCNPYFSWFVWGPFHFQTGRVFAYMAYFLVGVAFGAYGMNRTFLSSQSTLPRRWAIWVALAFLALIFNLTCTFRPGGTNPLLTGISLLLFCAAACLALLGVFLRFVRKPRRAFGSLSSNSYGIYVVHYTLAAWLLYAMLKVPLPGTVKGLIVFVSGLAICWGIIAVLRRIPRVRRVI